MLPEKHSAFFNLCLVGSFTLIFCCHARLRGYIKVTHEQRGRLCYELNWGGGGGGPEGGGEEEEEEEECRGVVSGELREAGWKHG